MLAALVGSHWNILFKKKIASSTDATAGSSLRTTCGTGPAAGICTHTPQTPEYLVTIWLHDFFLLIHWQREKGTLCFSLCSLQTYAGACPVSPALSCSNFPSEPVTLQHLLSMLTFLTLTSCSPCRTNTCPPGRWNISVSVWVFTKVSPCRHIFLLYLDSSPMILTLHSTEESNASVLVFIIEMSFVMCVTVVMDHLLISTLEWISPLKW